MSEPTARWYRPMTARSTDEQHRAATPLELFFDLCFVVAVSVAASRLHHSVAEDHVGHGVLGYVMVFFAIWWAWMNFTWFASAYDTDDGLYRVTTLVQITGVLVLAAGVQRAFDDVDFSVITAGYVLMRLAMVAQWLRAARADPEHRSTCRRYAVGIALVQAGWVARLLLPDSMAVASFVLLVLAEAAVPVIAERPNRTTFHPRHIAERYGLFTLIVLGESVLAATTAIGAALDEPDGDTGSLLGVAAAGLVIVFALWWLYFDHTGHDLLTSLRTSLTWGYGHYVIFASVAAVGAGLEVAVDHDRGVAHVGTVVAGCAITVPVALFLVSVWVLQVRPHQPGLAHPLVAALVLAAPLTHAPVHVTAVLLVALVVWAARTRKPAPAVPA